MTRNPKYRHTTNSEFKKLNARRIPPGNGGFSDFIAISVKMLLFEGCWNQKVSINEALSINNHEIKRYIEKYNQVSDYDIVRISYFKTRFFKLLEISDHDIGKNSELHFNNLLNILKFNRKRLLNYILFSKTNYHVDYIDNFINIVKQDCYDHLNK